MSCKYPPPPFFPSPVLSFHDGSIGTHVHTPMCHKSLANPSNSNRDMDNYPRGAQIDYEKLVNDAVCKVFSEHLGLFTFEGEDQPLVCELFDVPGAAEAAAAAAAAAAARQAPA